MKAQGGDLVPVLGVLGQFYFNSFTIIVIVAGVIVLGVLFYLRAQEKKRS